MVVYVDDMMLPAAPKDASGLWKALEKNVLYKDPEAKLERYLGALYNFKDFDPKRPDAPCSMSTSMDAYVVSAIKRFKAE